MSLSKNTTSAENGRHSHGPVTEAGKNRSRFNAVKDGAYAKRLIIIEHETGFDQALQEFIDIFQPGDELQMHLVESMLGARLRLNRAFIREHYMHEDAMGHTGDPGEDYYQGVKAMDTPEFQKLRRLQTNLQLMFQRDLNALIKVRTHFPAQEMAPEPEIQQAEPEPTPEPVAADPAPAATPAKSPEIKPVAPAAPPKPEFQPVNNPKHPEDDWPKAA